MIYVARHGQTPWNAENKVCGRTNVELTEQGIRQAGEMAEKTRSLPISRIISSPLRRAVATAQAAAQLHGLEIIIDERLIEQDYGIYEGVDRKDERFLANKRMFAWRYPGGESMMQVAARVYSLLDELRRDCPGEDVLLVCHGGVCRLIHTYFHDMTNDAFFHFSPENGELLEYEFDE